MPTRKLFRGDPYRYSRCLCLLLQYTEDVMADTSSLTGRELKSQLFDAERATMLAVLAVIGETDEGLMVSEGPNVSSVQRTIILSRVVGYAQSLCNQINDVRALRRSAFLSAFPTIHWGLLGVLGFTIPSLFIVLASTSKGSTVELLSDELIRCLFASLATSILSLLVLLADLNNPFAGNYRVADGEAFETPRQQIYAALGELESVHGPSMRVEHERLARLVALGPAGGERLDGVACYLMHTSTPFVSARDPQLTSGHVYCFYTLSLEMAHKINGKRETHETCTVHSVLHLLGRTCFSASTHNSFSQPKRVRLGLCAIPVKMSRRPAALPCAFDRRQPQARALDRPRPRPPSWCLAP